MVDRFAQLPPRARNILVAFSGGPDSTALLHACVEACKRSGRSLRAIHVDHGMQTESADWKQHCATFCRKHDISLICETASVDINCGSGPEAAARDARYQAVEKHLGSEDVLLTAHHRQDVAETLLLNLMRGSGATGLGGIAEHRELGQGFLWRPVLDLPPVTLRMYLESNQLSWIDDPSNENTDLRRNFLRHEIFPRLNQKWPEAQAKIASTAGYMKAVSNYLDQQAQEILDACCSERRERLSFDSVNELHPGIQSHLLRAWTTINMLERPGQRHVQPLLEWANNGVRNGAKVCWGESQVRIYDKHFYAMRSPPTVPKDWSREWYPDRPLHLPDGLGVINLHPRPGAGHETIPEHASLSVTFRKGGEKIRLDSGQPRRSLKYVFQQLSIPNWWRNRMPLIFDGELLVAIGDNILDIDFSNRLKKSGCRLRWTGHQLI